MNYGFEALKEIEKKEKIDNIVSSIYYEAYNLLKLNVLNGQMKEETRTFVRAFHVEGLL